MQQTVGADTIRFETNIPESTEPIIISGEHIRIVSEWVAPQTDSAIPDTNQWEHKGRSENHKVLAGTAGIIITDYFSAKDIDIEREVWISGESDAFAVHQRVCNRGPDPIRLKSLIPLRCKTPQSIIISGDDDPENWDILIQQRHKNGSPRTIRPSGNAKFTADQFCLFHTNARQGAPVLLIGYLSQTGHLARMLLEFHDENGKTQLDHFTAECEFDHCLMPPGGERTSQWVFVRMGYNPNKLIADFADRVGKYHGVAEPDKSAPSVFCSWYFHSFHYSEEYLNEDLNALKEFRIPFDVLLIDECWSLNKWGDWLGLESWPSGMKAAADRIRSMGYKPGIWTAPYLVDFESKLANDHPEWLLRNEDGELVTFPMNGIDHCILDLTFPGVCDYLEETFRRISHDWGFEYFKFDFMRAAFLDKGQRYYNPSSTSLEGYRLGLEAIRRGTGPDAHLSVCGGHFAGSMGIADSQRSGSDVVSVWDARGIPKFRQNILRTWMNRLWHVDPDAMMVRRRDEAMHNSKLTLGRLTDQEANTFALNQYIGGGLVCFAEYLCELDADRRALYRHVIPSVNSASMPLDIFDPLCPSQMLTRISPVCPELAPWVTISVINWSDESRQFSVNLSEFVLESIQSRQLLVSEFFGQEILGIFAAGEEIDLGFLEPHTSRLLRIYPWNNAEPALAGTDLHFSGGGVEVTEWKIIDGRIEGRIDTQWQYPVRITAAFPAENDGGYTQASVVVEPGQKWFYINPS